MGARIYATDFKKLLEEMRHYPEPYRKGVGKLVHHIYFLDNEITNLNRELSTYKQKMLFESMETAKKNEKIVMEEVKVSRGQRMWETAFEGKRAVDLYLKFNHTKTLDDVLNEANDWARENNRNTISKEYFKEELKNENIIMEPSET